jgi:two-component system chemotaxis sensor kinase CheA
MSENTIRDVFLEEAKEILRHLEADLIQLEDGSDPELVNRIFRYVHTIKGSSGIAGFDAVYEFTHSLEGLLDMVRNGKIAVERKLIDLLLESMDWITTGIYEEPDAVAMKEILGKIHEYKIEERPEEEAAAPAKDAPREDKFNFFLVRASFRPMIFESGIDPLLIMEDLTALGSVEQKRVNLKRLPDFKEIDPERCYIDWTILLKTRQPRAKVEEVFLFVKEDNDITVEDITAEFVDDERYNIMLQEQKLGEILLKRGIIDEEELEDVLSEQDESNSKLGDLIVRKGYADEKDIKYALGEQNRIKSRIQNTTVRVDTRKLDSLLNLLGEIVISQSSISRISEELEEQQGFRLKNALYAMDRITREFQEQIMAIRMIPIGPTFEQFRRFVRDSAADLMKEIRMEIRGAETELDKTVIEQISDPLKHMIRNAIDHGIETPAEREKAGKKASGTITLNAYHQEGNIYIEIIDDGMGIDRAAVRKKAVEKGLVKASDELTDKQVHDLLFMPGFSTAQNVGELSGRGVGMDVVKTNIEALRGSVEIFSEERKGTTIRIKLPLTLAIIEGMLVRVGANIYIIPLLSIVESLQPQRDHVKTIEGKGEVVLVRGEYVPLIRLYEVFGIESDITDPWESLVVVVESGMDRLGFMIDDLVGQQQIVIKSLETYITQSRALSGAAILGDGKVALIIDVHGMVSDISS